jgi:hypothetical protein
MAGINIILAGASIVFFGRFIREKVRTDAHPTPASNTAVAGAPTIRLG